MQLKRRPMDKPFSFMCSDLTDISQYAHVSNTAYRLMKKSLPGPYTFVLPGTKLVPKVMATKQKTVGIRVPAIRSADCSSKPSATPSSTPVPMLADEEAALAEPYLIERVPGQPDRSRSSTAERSFPIRLRLSI